MLTRRPAWAAAATELLARPETDASGPLAKTVGGAGCLRLRQRMILGRVYLHHTPFAAFGQEVFPLARGLYLLHLEPVGAGLHVDLEGHPQLVGALHLVADQAGDLVELAVGDLED